MSWYHIVNEMVDNIQHLRGYIFNTNETRKKKIIIETYKRMDEQERNVRLWWDQRAFFCQKRPKYWTWGYFNQ